LCCKPNFTANQLYCVDLFRETTKMQSKSRNVVRDWKKTISSSGPRIKTTIGETRGCSVWHVEQKMRASKILCQ